jgi:hypothetical protein
MRLIVQTAQTVTIRHFVHAIPLHAAAAQLLVVGDPS